jgi:hypothetical protein
MSPHVMVVLSNAKPGQDEPFNRWYSDVHMIETIDRLDGFLSAQRYRRADLDGAPPCPYRYLAVYEIPDDELETAYAQFTWQRAERAAATAAGRAPVVSVSDTLQPDPFLVGFFSPITERVLSTRTREPV